MQTKRPDQLQRGDIIELSTEALRVEAAPVVKGPRVILTVRTSEDGCGLSQRSYLSSYLFNVRD